MVDHPAWVALQNHLSKNAEAYIAAIGALFVASVCAAPPICPFIPGEIDTPVKRMVQANWTWFRDSLQIAVPAARANSHTATQTVETPQLKTTTSTSDTTPKETK